MMDVSDRHLPSPSRSGARLTGDDLQHLVAWYWALQLLRPEEGIASIEVEALAAGNVDDVVVHRVNGAADCYQIKGSVSARESVSSEWLTRASRTGGPSILQRFWTSWRNLKTTRQTVTLTLLTSHPLDATDPVLGCRDGKGYLGTNLRRAKRNSSVQQRRAEWIAHLEATDAEFDAFLDELRFETDALEATWRQRVRDLSHGLGLRADDAAIRLGVTQIREWVKQGRIARTAEDIRAAVELLELKISDPYGVLLVQALDTEPLAGDETEVFDWVRYFPGDEPRTRRATLDPTDWQQVLKPELRDVAQRIRSAGYTQVLIRGQMRLPTWFAVGTYLGKTAGFNVASIQNGVLWSSSVHPPSALPSLLTLSDARFGDGNELAITIAVATDPTPDVVAYCQTNIDVGRHVALSPVTAPGSHAVEGPEHALALALAIRDEVRQLTREMSASVAHLFLAMPHGLALLLGHLWDRLPPTQLYEDLGSGRGYAASFHIPN